MNCRNAKNKIKAFLDGELPCSEQEILKQHLKTCPECSQEADSLSKTWEMLLELPGEKDVPDIVPGVLERISRQEEKGSFPGRIMEWAEVFKPSFATATVFAMITGFTLGAGIAKSLSENYRNANMVEDTLYIDIFSDLPDSSISGAYISFINEEKE